MQWTVGVVEEVVDLGGDPAHPGDVDQFVQRLEQLVALAAHVRDVHAAILSDDLRQRDELGCLGVERRGVDQRSAESESAVLHRLPAERPHPFELARRRCAVCVADFVNPQRCRPDEGRHVDADAGRLQMLQVFGERRP